MWKRLWSAPVWSKVIAAAILAGLGAVLTYFLQLWPIIASAVRTTNLLLLRSSPVPNWLIRLLCLLALPSILLFASAMWPNKAVGTSKDEWRQYTSDHFFGLLWRWEYSGSALINLSPFCSNCDYQVYPQHASGYRVIDRYVFHCNSCNLDIHEIDEPFVLFENKVMRFIQQKLRTGTWPR